MKKEVTIYDIAKVMNLSPSTISRALSNNKLIKKTTKTKILAKAEDMGYRHNNFASNLRNQKSNVIGVMFHKLNSNFITSVLAGIENVTTEAGYNILIAHSSESFDKEVSNAMNLFHQRVDGVIASLSLNSKGLSHFKQFFDKNIPVIFFDRVDENSERMHVIIDNYKCGYIATEHLISQGCRNIVMLTASLKRNVYAKRHKGYADALFDAGIEFNKKLVLVKEMGEENAIEAAHEILKIKPFPDGLFVMNDFMAAVCMQELKRNGVRVPEDIAIVGFNNDAISKIVDPQLTTINYPGKEMGEIAARHLISQLKGLGNIATTNRIIIKAELIVRKSSVKK
jgi:LacI family transcriptional regulator